jgi:hypothetical protein
MYGAFLLGTMAMRRHLTGRWLPEVSFLDWLRGDDESGVD